MSTSTASRESASRDSASRDSASRDSASRDATQQAPAPASTHRYYPSGNPRFNHVAMSLPADLLDEEHRRDICRFWDEVFGFTELPTMTLDRQRLILSCVHWDQFIFLIADDRPMTCPRLDHFGLAVGSLDELQSVRDRAAAFRAHDDRVDLIDIKADDQGVVTIHSMYVRYLLPMMCELQYWELPEPT